MGPRMNSSTMTNGKRSQTLILAKDGDDRTLVFSTTISRVVGKPEQWLQGVCKHGVELSLAYKKEN